MIDQLIERAEGYQAHKVDFTQSTENMHFEPMNCGLVLEGGVGNTVLQPTDYAFGQVYSRLGPVALGGSKSLPREYMEKCPDLLRSINLNHWMARMNPATWFVRAYDDKARAVLSDRFSAVDALDCLKWTKEALDSQKYAYKFHNVSLTPDYMRMSISMNELKVPDGGKNKGTGGVYAIGCDLGTGEIGNAKIWCNPYVQRTSCTNSIVYSESDYSYQHRHVGIRENLARTFMVCVFNALKGCEEVLQTLVKSIEEPMPKIEEIIGDMAKRNGWSQELSYGVAMGTEGESNLWGLVQGVSYAANLIDNPEDQLKMQQLAGDLLMRQPAYTTEL